MLYELAYKASQYDKIKVLLTRMQLSKECCDSCKEMVALLDEDVS